VRVLVVEDERNLADAIGRGLRRAGMAVDVAYDGLSGHELAFVTRYDVIVLDRDLPGKPGDEICADLVASGALTRVLMLTASASVADRVEGLGLGADDYLAKPFAFDELVARVRALGRRSSPAAPPVLTVGDLVLDQAKRTVTRSGKPLDLTPHHPQSFVPRFTPDALAANMPVVDLMSRFAAKKDATPAQIALAWLLAQKPFIVPIPGTRNIDHLTENLGALNVALTPADLQELDSDFAKITVHGARMDEANMQIVE